MKGYKKELESPDHKPYIVYNEHLQVWTGLLFGGLELSFSDNYDDAKPLYNEAQFRTLQKITMQKLEKEYI
jgi:hypothetical protein